jgi:hypothetical protein
MPVSTRTMARTITEAKGGLQRDQSPVHQHRLLRLPAFGVSSTALSAATAEVIAGMAASGFRQLQFA